MCVHPQDCQDRGAGVGGGRGLFRSRLLQQHPREGATYWRSGGFQAKTDWSSAWSHPHPTTEQDSGTGQS